MSPARRNGGKKPRGMSVSKQLRRLDIGIACMKSMMIGKVHKPECRVLYNDFHGPRKGGLFRERSVELNGFLVVLHAKLGGDVVGFDLF